MIWFLLKNLTMHLSLAALSSYETKFLSQLSVIRSTHRPNNIISICNHMNTSAIWEIIPWSNFQQSYTWLVWCGNLAPPFPVRVSQASAD